MIFCKSSSVSWARPSNPVVRPLACTRYASVLSPAIRSSRYPALAAEELRSFAASHVDEAFYGFAFSCEGEYGDLKLALNA
jgi:hypothetical protein